MKEARDPVIRILLVDDNHALAKENQRALLNQPNVTFQVTIYHDGHKAIQAVATQPQGFDVALVDYYLNDPDLNGVEVMRRLFEYNASLPVILFTGQDLSIDGLGIGAITEGAYHYISLPKGSRINEIAAHCRMAVRDRANRRRLLAEEVSHALQQSRDIGSVLRAYVDELDRLGYKAGAIYLHAPGWLVGDSVGLGLRTAQQHQFLRRARVFNAPQLPLFYDLSAPTRIEGVLRQDQAVTLYQAAEGDIYVAIPLRDQVSRDRLLGAVLLGPHSAMELDEEEIDVLGRLGHQMALAVRNAVDFRQLNYRSTVWDALLETNRDIQPLLDHSNTRQQILDKLASTIAAALGFRRVVISVITHTRSELCGTFGLSAQQEAECRSTMTPVDELLKLDQEFYRFESSSSYFIPEGCYDFQRFGGHLLSDTPHEAETSPWDWHGGDQLRTRVQNVRGETVAYIAADERRTGRPGESTFRAMEIFAIRLADLLETMTSRRYQQALEVIKEVSDRLNRITERRELFKTIHDQLASLMDAETIKIGLYNKQQQCIEIAYQYGEPDELASISLNEGLIGYIVRTGESLIFSTAWDIQRFHTDHNIEILGQPASSWIGVPIQATDRSETIGVIALEHNQSAYIYDELDQHILSILSDSVASALRRIAAEEARDRANIEALDTVAGELIGATVSIRRVEQLILARVTELIGADCGIFLHYNSREDKLVIIPEDWYIRDPAVDHAPAGTLSYPLHPPLGQPTSLTVQAAQSHAVCKWDEITQEPNYISDVPGMHSLIAMPVFIPDSQGSERLFGVWTLQARQTQAFDADHIKLLEAFSRFAVQAVQRVQQQEQNELLLLWAERHRGSVVIQHRLPNLIRGLHDTFQTGERTLRHLERVTHDLAVDAQKHTEVRQYGIEKTEALRLNRLVLDVLENYEVPGGAMLIEPKFELHLPDEAVVYGNKWGLEEVLTIILDNAYGKLRESERRRHLQVLTDREADGSFVVRLFNSGPPLRDDVAAFLAGPDHWDVRYEGLAQARLLLSLYGANLIVTRNNAEGVEFTLCWAIPDHAPTAALSSVELRRHMDRIQRTIARRQAMRFAHYVARRNTQIAPRYEQLLASLGEAAVGIGQLKEALEDDLLTCDAVDVLNLVNAVYQDMKRWKAKPNITIRYQSPRRTIPTPIMVWTNRTTLLMVLHNLIENAVRAINKDAAAGVKGSRQVITLKVATNRQSVLISIRNTGSMVDPVLQAMLVDQPVPQKDGHGMAYTTVMCYFGTVTENCY